MTPGQYLELTKQIDKLIEDFSMQEAMAKSAVMQGIRGYVDQDMVEDQINTEEPEINDEVKFCPECEKPNQFGELCERCRNEIEREARP